jgi:hypothetical protein
MRRQTDLDGHARRRSCSGVCAIASATCHSLGRHRDAGATPFDSAMEAEHPIKLCSGARWTVRPLPFPSALAFHTVGIGSYDITS